MCLIGSEILSFIYADGRTERVKDIARRTIKMDFIEFDSPLVILVSQYKYIIKQQFKVKG